MENNQAGTDTNAQQSTGYSADYVKQLREEAASWRTKFRELETQQKTYTVQEELNKRGIKANAKWVDVQEGQSITEAVEAFTKEYPHLVIQTNTEPTEPDNTKAIKKVIGPKPNTPPVTNINSTKSKDLNTALKTGSLNDIKNDPNLRKQTQQWYQSMLAGKK